MANPPKPPPADAPGFGPGKPSVRFVLHHDISHGVLGAITIPGTIAVGTTCFMSSIDHR